MYTREEIEQRQREIEAHSSQMFSMKFGETDDIMPTATFADGYTVDLDCISSTIMGLCSSCAKHPLGADFCPDANEIRWRAQDDETHYQVFAWRIATFNDTPEDFEKSFRFELTEEDKEMFNRLREDQELFKTWLHKAEEARGRKCERNGR